MYNELFRRVQAANKEIRSIRGTIKRAQHLTILEVKDDELRTVVSELYDNRHYSEAVAAGYKYLNNLVKTRCGVDSLDGADLMRQAFSPKKPLLKINPNVTQSERNEQLGYMDIYAGCMTGIRNPRAHETYWPDDEYQAKLLIELADHLVTKVRNASYT
ncbi:MAG TPA: TIGR02391 family protein [Selenomonadales bacterium]|nr:TIGR02391 family protein [Selenomonadales bacterium]